MDKTSWTYSMKEIHSTVCPRSGDPFYIVSYNMKWVTTSWTYSMLVFLYNFVSPSQSYIYFIEQNIGGG